MVWKSANSSSSSNYTREPYIPRPRRRGNIVASVTSPRNTVLERICRIDNELLGYNLGCNKVLIKFPQNDADFEQFVALPFTKGATERKTGRTLLILGSNAHHVEAMQNQFSNVLWKKGENIKETKRFGDTIRWINVGDIRYGFIGLDYEPTAEQSAGVAKTPQEISFLARTLLEYGYDNRKNLFVLKPPYIQEREEGLAWRKQGLISLRDWANRR